MTRRLIILGEILVLASLTAWSLLAPKELPRTRVLSLDSIPLRIKGWEGRRVPLSSQHPARVGGVNAAYVRYRKQGFSLDLYVVEARPGTFSLHPPEYCLLGGISEEVSRSRLNLPCGPGSIEVNRFVARRDWRNSLIYYWYSTGDDYTPSYLAQQAAGLRARLTGKVKPLSLIRISWDGDERVEGVESYFRDFIREAFPEISPVLLNENPSAPGDP